MTQASRAFGESGDGGVCAAGCSPPRGQMLILRACRRAAQVKAAQLSEAGRGALPRSLDLHTIVQPVERTNQDVSHFVQQDLARGHARLRLRRVERKITIVQAG